MTRISVASLRWKLIALGAILWSHQAPAAVYADDLSCSVSNDNCPTKFNSRCDQDSNPECADGDCFDCDACQQFHNDCNGCLVENSGCYWCPGDGTCYNSNRYELLNIFSHCSNPSDFVQDSCSSPENAFDDPSYSAQEWVYEMINIRPVWDKGLFGNGIRVRVNDDGVDAPNPEFQGRFDIDGSCEVYEPPTENVIEDFSPSEHGTWIAAILGGAADNGLCSAGIAPKVTISSCYALTREPFLDTKLDAFDISQNSWGTDGCAARSSGRRHLGPKDCPFTFDASPSFPCTTCDFSNISKICENKIVRHCRSFFREDVTGCSEFFDLILGDGTCRYDALNDQERNALIRGVTDGRDGKGVIFLFASGNALKSGDVTTFQSYTNSRLVISVGAVGKESSHASYSTPGPSLFVSGPGGDNGNVSNHVVAGLDGSCKDIGIGTSFACPVVSGVVALLLEANPQLTWRDVQNLLALTSRRVLDLTDSSNYENAAGYWHSNMYGFGVVDAAVAVEAAETWELVGPEQLLVEQSGTLNLPIADKFEQDSSASALISAITIDSSSSTANFVIESVALQLDLQHFSRGDLQIVLTSPQGTKSELTPGSRPENTQLDSSSEERWKLLTLRNWGESPYGEWTLSILDTKQGDSDECANAAWGLLHRNDETLDCFTLEFMSYCENGVLDPLDKLSQRDFDIIFNYVDNALTALQACCACGGGIATDDVVDQLTQWTLVIYGREDTTTRNLPTTDVPSTTPSMVHLVEPSLSPSVFPTQSPSLVPSLLEETPEPSQATSNRPANVARTATPSITFTANSSAAPSGPTETPGQVVESSNPTAIAPTLVDAVDGTDGTTVSLTQRPSISSTTPTRTISPGDSPSPTIFPTPSNSTNPDSSSSSSPTRRPSVSFSTPTEPPTVTSTPSTPLDINNTVIPDDGTAPPITNTTGVDPGDKTDAPTIAVADPTVVGPTLAPTLATSLPTLRVTTITSTPASATTQKAATSSAKATIPHYGQGLLLPIASFLLIFLLGSTSSGC